MKTPEIKIPNISQEQMTNILDTCYNAALTGLPTSKSCSELAAEYLAKYKTPEAAANNLIKWQIAKCATSGFLTSLGGMVTLPVALPANIASVIYVQLRMIAAIAVIGGFDPKADEVQTLTYICLAGTQVSKICREAGIKFAQKLTMSMVKKIPGTVLYRINQKVAFRLITKTGTKGIVNLAKMVPVAGGLVGGTFDFVGTKAIAAHATAIFLKGQID